MSIALGVVLWMLSASSTPLGSQPAQGLACVKWHPESRARVYGYDHLVHLHNQCKKPAICEVVTNVNPDKIDKALEPNEKATLLTFMDSPARVFYASVTCAEK